jgi:hypothetical protein
MTDSQYQAKLWLRRYKTNLGQLESDKKLLMVRETVVNKCTSTYKSDGGGSRDIDAQKGKYEDALADFSEMKVIVEREERKLLDLFDEITETLRRLSDPLHQKIATDLYLRLMKWDAVQDEEHISRSTLDRKHRDMLTELAKLLRI